MKAVHMGTIEIEYVVREHEMDDGEHRYDWVTQNGEESDCNFASVFEAVVDIESHF